MFHYEVNRYKIRVRRPAAGRGRLRAAFLTDLHGCSWGEGNELLFEALDAEDPDVCLVGGDMITAVPGETTDIAEEFMAELAYRYPVYYACGNHEYRLRLYPEVYGDLYKKYFAALKKYGVIFLPDRAAETTVNGVRLKIYGLNIMRRYYSRFKPKELPVSGIDQVFGSPSETSVNILLAHTPKFMETYLDWGADLTLCGHYHGGIVRFGRSIGAIDPNLGILSKRAKGRFGKDGRTCIVSAGLGEHSIKLRINNPRELVMLDIMNG